MCIRFDMKITVDGAGWDGEDVAEDDYSATLIRKFDKTKE
ncbi:MAG: hypothetical protein ACI9BW_004470 [Gammaproteobacteria bacterium]|jgi:hypothetical protein